MASSSGPIDAVEQRSFWAVNVEHTLRIMREELDNEMDCEFRIFKVLETYRQPTAEFTPEEWRFGLHNREENLNMSEPEAAKRAVVVLFGLDEQLNWTTFCDAVVPDPRAMLKCYGLHKEVNALLEAEIKQVLAFDALFLAVCIELSNDMAWESMKLVSKQLWNSDRRWKCFRHSFELFFPASVMLDICKIENQIPFDLIKNSINHVLKLTNPRQTQDPASCTYTKAEQVSDEYLEMWMKAAVKQGMVDLMDISNDFYEGGNATMTLSESYHILGAAHKVICGVVGMERESDLDQKDYIYVPSATRLKESGIRIKAVAGPLSVMSYDRETSLSMPKMNMFDDTVALVRNMARYEYLMEGEFCMFHDYVRLMLDLIQTPLDLDYMVKCGVIDNGCGNKAVHKWGALCDGLMGVSSSKEHNKMKSDINERCKLRRHRLWSEFKTLFLSRPWLTLSAVAVTLVTLATLIQTYAAVISSNGMKPQFNP